MADPKAEMDALKKELEAAKKEAAALKALLPAQPVRPTPVSGTFRLTERHYRLGKMYEAGETITITDEVPGKTWVPVEGTAPVVAMGATQAPAGRPADKSVM